MNRWLHLAGYGLLVFSSQILWVTFSPITTDVAAEMNTSVGNIGTLAALFPIIYIVVAFPSGRWLDTHFKQALIFGALTVGIGAVGRLVFPFHYPWQLSLQVILAIGQPFIINAISAYAARYFPEKNRSLAISIASVSMFLGVIFAMVFSPLIYANGGLIHVFTFFAIPAVLSMIWVIYTVLTTEFYVNDEEHVETSASNLKELLSEPFLWILSGLLAIGLGIFDAFSTWIEPIFIQFDIPGTTSGPLLAVMLVSGVVGSMILPSWAHKRNARRFILTIALSLTVAALIAIAVWQAVPWIAFWFIVSGFFLLAGYPIVMDWTEKYFKVEQQGTAIGFVMLTSHAGGVVMIYLVKLFLTPATLALSILALITMLGFLLIRLLKQAGIN